MIAREPALKRGANEYRANGAGFIPPMLLESQTVTQISPRNAPPARATQMGTLNAKS
jgi:hypothetical protein